MKLHIAEIPPLWETIPPKGYGAIEYLTNSLVQNFVLQGHTVTTYTSSDSTMPGNKKTVCRTSLNSEPQTEPELLRIIQHSLICAESTKYDIIHCHLHSNSGWLALPLLAHLGPKVIFSIHTFATELNRSLLCNYPHCNYIATSKSHAESFKLPFIKKFIHHGINIDDFSYSSIKTRNDYLLYLGRIRKEKGVDIAIKVAKECKTLLKIAGRVKKEDYGYFKEHVEPSIKEGYVEYIGEVGMNEKNTLLNQSIALLHPTQISEPFGLVVIEAMACGTPVICTNMGSMPELVNNGVTGFICNSFEDMVKHVQSCKTLNRERVRKHVESKFSDKVMSEKYIHNFYKILGDHNEKTR